MTDLIEQLEALAHMQVRAVDGMLVIDAVEAIKLLTADGPTMDRGHNGDGTPWIGTMRECLEDALSSADAERREVTRLTAELAAIKEDLVAEVLDLNKCIRERDAELAALQSKHDALMLEHCPDEMTEGQLTEWGKHQAPAQGEPVVWVGCGECDVAFPCYDGRQYCLRLHEPPALKSGEPVAWVERLDRASVHCVTDLKYCSVAQHERGDHLKYIPLYAAAPTAPTLTDEQIKEIHYRFKSVGGCKDYWSFAWLDFARAVIAAARGTT